MRRRSVAVPSLTSRSLKRRSGHPKVDAWPGLVVASDEVGYGAWAGPCLVCAASAPLGWDDPRVQDSKSFDDEKVRDRLFEEFSNDPRFLYKIVVLSSETIDRMGVYTALQCGHEEALKEVAQHLEGRPLGVVDGNLPVYKFEVGFDLVALPKADQLVPECSLASILAKVTRDRLMAQLDKEHPGYGWASNKGYGGNAAHEEGLRRLGPSPQHRTSYGPIARLIAEREQGGQLQRAWELLDEDS